MRRRIIHGLVAVFFLLNVLDLCHSTKRQKGTKKRSLNKVHCQLSPDPGNCGSRIRKWHYDWETGICKPFVWTGCGGNENRFQSPRQCKRTCSGLSAEGDIAAAARLKSDPVAAKCRRFPCRNLDCRHGYSMAVDDNGCQTCRCAAPMSVQTTSSDVGVVSVREGIVCSPVFCNLTCADGLQRDANGCETCRCNTVVKHAQNSTIKVTCPGITCSLSCRHGYQVGADGCQRCVCRDVDGPAVEETGPCDAAKTCGLSCPEGYERDAFGCEVCECRPLADQAPQPSSTGDSNGGGHAVPCAPFDEFECAATCEYFVIGRDKNDCEFCSCLVDDPTKNTTPLKAERRCPSPSAETCSLDCPQGRELDENGCEICGCSRHQEEELVETGHELVTDAESVSAAGGLGCPLVLCSSECRMVQTADCPACDCSEDIAVAATATATEAAATRSSCPDLNCEDLVCPGGHQVDASGCPVCACAEEISETGSSIEEVVLTLSPTSKEEEKTGSTISYTTLIVNYVFDEDEDRTSTPPVISASDNKNNNQVTKEEEDGDDREEEMEEEEKKEDEEDDSYPAAIMCNGRRCGKKCRHGLRRSEYEDCFICECDRSLNSDPKRLVDIGVYNARKDICSLPKHRGPCRANLTRWYFSRERHACQKFEYGGCRGHANNFRSEASCQEFCLPEINQDRATRQDKYRKILGW